MIASRVIVVVVGLVVGCGTETGEPPRSVDVEVTVGANGFSEPFTIDVPEHTRSLTIVATGAADGLYALGAFQTADGAEHVGLDLGAPPGAQMRSSYDTEQIGQMPGMLFQTIRLGTFTHVYPYRPDQSVVAGTTTLRIASDRPGPVRVRVLMPPDDGGQVLHVNLFVVSDTLVLAQPAPFLDELQTIFNQVGITIVVDETRVIAGSGLARITQSTEPQEAPGSQSARLPALATNPLSPGALDIFIVESLPSGIGGLSLGTPGPPVRDSYYYGVVIRYTANEMAMAIVVAHEASHFLALQHVTNTGISGTVYPDPLDDTQPGQSNLMQTGTALTADQGFALTRSALLSVD
ncbi:MAG: hypothetical protein JNL83_34210 [Myxococcales bacterium]|nr:hypothetical protein [Myxococcales bacterium]